MSKKGYTMQKLRPSKKNGFEPLTVTIPAVLRAELIAQAQREGETLSRIVRILLREGLKHLEIK